MFTPHFVLEGKDRPGRPHDYVVWLSIGNQSKLDFRTSYLPSTPILTMKFRTQIGKSPYSPENPHILRRIWIFSYLCAELHADNWG